MHYTTSCNTQFSAPEDGQNNCPKHVELTGIINNLVGCIYYLYKWCKVKQIWDNEIYLLIKYIKRVLWRVVKRLSYIEEARCLKVNDSPFFFKSTIFIRILTSSPPQKWRNSKSVQSKIINHQLYTQKVNFCIASLCTFLWVKSGWGYEVAHKMIKSGLFCISYESVSEYSIVSSRSKWKQKWKVLLHLDNGWRFLLGLDLHEVQTIPMFGTKVELTASQRGKKHSLKC